MKRITVNPLVALTIASLALGGCASRYIRSGKQSYEDLQYQDAIWSLEKGLARQDNPEARRLLAESYMMVNEFTKANEEYGKVALYSDNTDRDRVLQGQALMANGRYTEAREIFDGILTRDPGNKLAASLSQSCKKMTEMKRDSLFIQIANVNIPTEAPVYSAFPYQDGLIITSPAFRGEDDPYTNKAFTDLYVSRKNGASWTAPQALTDVNGPYHDAVAAVSPNGQLMVFTRNFQLGARSLGSDDKNVSNTQLYMSRRLPDGTWQKPELMPFCTHKFMFAHPTFTADGTTMYFSSNMSGSGQMDIFMVKQSEGVWGVPQNIGTGVNTAGNEVFPSVRQDGRLYFSSDGHTTIGGLDVLFSESRDGSWQAPRHMSYPLNSSYDDFSIAWNSDGKTGYFSSDRTGADRIYFFSEVSPIISLEGLIIAKDGGIPVGGTRVTIINMTDGTEKITFAGPDGIYQARLLMDKDYKVKIERDGFFTTTEDFTTSGITADQRIRRVTELSEVYITGDKKDDDGSEDSDGATDDGKDTADGGDGKDQKDGSETGDGTTTGDNKGDGKNGGKGNNKSVYPIPNIYWDFNDSRLRPDAIPYLEDIVKLFSENQDYRFEIRSHCDCRGSEGFNEDLSSRRAEAVMKYLISRGVPRHIINSRGMGKKELLNGCDCEEGETCTEAQHQENRRTEFIVTDRKKRN